MAGGKYYKGRDGNIEGDGNVYCFDHSNGFVGVRYVKTDQIVYFKYVQFSVFYLYFNKFEK